MRSLFRSIGIAAGILVVAGVQNASAQIAYPVEFTTSFPFAVGYATVPAGHYTIRPDDDNPAVFELTGEHGSVLFEANAAEAREVPSKSEVVFKRYGDGYVLKNIWVSGSQTGAETTTVENEKHAAKHHQLDGEERVAAVKKSDAPGNR
jgi:hypothetical protein